MPFFTKFFSNALHCPRNSWCVTTSAAEIEIELVEAALLDLSNYWLVF